MPPLDINIYIYNLVVIVASLIQLLQLQSNNRLHHRPTVNAEHWFTWLKFIKRTS